jgi:excisionase family DNA binding protein
VTWFGPEPAHFDAINMTEFLTIAEVAQDTGFSPRTVLRWVERGDLPAVRFPGGRLRVSQREYSRFLERRSTVCDQHMQQEVSREQRT